MRKLLFALLVSTSATAAAPALAQPTAQHGEVTVRGTVRDQVDRRRRRRRHGLPPGDRRDRAHRRRRPLRVPARPRGHDAPHDRRPVLRAHRRRRRRQPRASTSASCRCSCRARRSSSRPRRRTPPPARSRSPRDEIEHSAGSHGDPLLAIKNLPAIANTGLGIGQQQGLVIRGSSPADSRIFVDGFEIPLLYHLGGIQSIIPTEMIDVDRRLARRLRRRAGQGLGRRRQRLHARGRARLEGLCRGVVHQRAGA